MGRQAPPPAAMPSFSPRREARAAATRSRQAPRSSMPTFNEMGHYASLTRTAHYLAQRLHASCQARRTKPRSPGGRADIATMLPCRRTSRVFDNAEAGTGAENVSSPFESRSRLRGVATPFSRQLGEHCRRSTPAFCRRRHLSASSSRT